MKRFFTKSVACLLTLTLILSLSFFIFTTANAQGSGSDSWSDVFTVENATDAALGVISLASFSVWQASLAIITYVVSGFLTLAGLIFDLSLKFSIEKIGYFFNQVKELEQIWGLVRDSINIVLIFILLYIAITKIVGSFGIKAKTTLTQVIISAFFINFSMFITKALIDLGNLFTVAFYNQIISNGGAETSSISLEIMKKVSLAQFLKKDMILASGQAVALQLEILQIIMICVLVWVLLNVSFLLIGRMVMLIFLIVSSPIGFIGGSIPWIGDKAKEWWGALVNQILVAPIFMFLFLITMKIIKILPETSFSSNSGETNKVTTYIIYIITIVFLLKTLSITKKYSGEVGKVMTNVMKVVGTAAAIAVTAGAGAAIGGAMSAVGGATGRIAASSKLAGTGLGKTLTRMSFAATSKATSFSGKGMLNASKDFITGKNASGLSLGDDQSMRGKALNYLREKSLTNIKSGTGNYVDIKGLQKTIEDSAKKAAANVEKEAERVGPQKSLDRIEQINNTKENINNQVDARNKDEGINLPIKAKDAENYKKLIETEERLLEIAEKRQKLEEDELKAQNIGDLEEEKKARERKTKFEQDIGQEEKEKESLKKGLRKTLDMQENSTYDKTEINKAIESIEKRREEVAKEMGIEISKLDEELDKLGKDVVKKTQERNDFIKEIAEGNTGKFGLYNKKDAQKIADKLRGQKGKRIAEDDLLKNIKKALKDSGADKDTDEKDKKDKK